MLDIGGKADIIIHAVVTTTYQMQRYRRGHNEHDWKSCDGQKPSEGSNPSRCAKNNSVDRKAGAVCFLSKKTGS